MMRVAHKLGRVTHFQICALRASQHDNGQVESLHAQQAHAKTDFNFANNLKPRETAQTDPPKNGTCFNW